MSLFHTMVFFFFFNDTATTEIYTLSLHDALPISERCAPSPARPCSSGTLPEAGILQHPPAGPRPASSSAAPRAARSEEHTSELQSRQYLVCRLLLEKKNTKIISDHNWHTSHCHCP